MSQQEVGCAISIGGQEDDDDVEAQSKSQKIIDNWQMCELNFQTIFPRAGSAILVLVILVHVVYPGFSFCSWRFSIPPPALHFHPPFFPRFPAGQKGTCMI